ncbi:MAG: histidine phosphatase family protein [Bacteroidia bacterium]|nr:histidine phosphatase family protein [Bacteroidia bacterium]
MTKTLILVRHSLADAASVDKDFNRKLTSQGEKLAAKTAALILPHITGKLCVITSDAVRAYHTARIIAEVANLPEELIFSEHFIYQTYSDELFRHISSVPDAFDIIILTGHNPSVSELAAAFSNLNEALKPAEAVVLNFNTKNWAAISFDCVSRFVSPYSIIS